MLLWTIQSIQAWNRLDSSGILRAGTRFVDQHFLSAYRWMANRVHERLGDRPSRTSLPVWAWYQWEGHRKCQPDLRATGHLPKGEKGVRIEFEVDASHVVLSDFELWHYVLNYWYLPKSVREGEAFDAELEKSRLSFFKSKPLPSKKYHQRIEKSWERIFDLEWKKKGLASSKSEKSIQACLWEIRIENVKAVKEFISR